MPIIAKSTCELDLVCIFSVLKADIVRMLEIVDLFSWGINNPNQLR